MAYTIISEPWPELLLGSPLGPHTSPLFPTLLVHDKRPSPPPPPETNIQLYATLMANSGGFFWSRDIRDSLPVPVRTVRFTHTSVITLGVV